MRKGKFMTPASFCVAAGQSDAFQYCNVWLAVTKSGISPQKQKDAISDERFS